MWFLPLSILSHHPFHFSYLIYPNPSYATGILTIRKYDNKTKGRKSAAWPIDSSDLKAASQVKLFKHQFTHILLLCFYSHQSLWLLRLTSHPPHQLLTMCTVTCIAEEKGHCVITQGTKKKRKKNERWKKLQIRFCPLFIGAAVARRSRWVQRYPVWVRVVSHPAALGTTI